MTEKFPGEKVNQEKRERDERWSSGWDGTTLPSRPDDLYEGNFVPTAKAMGEVGHGPYVGQPSYVEWLENGQKMAQAVSVGGGVRNLVGDDAIEKFKKERY